MDNLAAWQRQPGQPLLIEPAEVPALAPGEILVRNEAVAINPLDYLLQDAAVLPWLDYPVIAGSDVAGTIVNLPSQGAFQQHTVVFAHMRASWMPLEVYCPPDNISGRRRWKSVTR